MILPDNAAFRIGDWRIDPALDEISRDGRTIKVEPRSMRVLVCLARRAGEVVSVDDLLDSVWKDVVVTHYSVYQAVAALRRAFGDDPKAPTYIANVLRRGYRLIAPVAALAISSPSAEGVAEPTSAEREPPAMERATAAGRHAPPAGASAPPASEPTSPAEGPRPPAKVIAGSPTASRGWWLTLALAAAIALALVLTSNFFRSTSRHKVMLVVLPFENLTGNAGQDYVADGLSEELITQLGSLDPAHLGVIARTSSMQYKGTHKNAAQIAQELGVSYLLEGSVRSSQEKVRIAAQLIVADDQTHLWAESFDGDSSDILRVQADVARAVADKIRLTLSAQTTARLSETPSLSPQAHDAYLQGLQAQTLRTRQSFELAIAEFQRAISIDPNYARAYAELSRTYALATVVGLGPPELMMRQARDAALRALQLDDSVAEAHTMLGFVYAHFEFDWAAAEREYHRAIALNPSDAYAHFFYSNSLLSPMGRHEEAIAEMKVALQLDPLSPPVDSFLGRTYLWARRYDEALAHLQKCIVRAPNFVLNHVRLGHLYTYMDRLADAIGEDTKARVLSGQDAREALSQEDVLRTALARDGSRGYWQRVLELSQTGFNAPEGYGSSYGAAIVYTRLGENDKALDSLERAYADRQLAMTEIAIEPAFDPLRSDARFVALLGRVGLGR
jgi:TolB-like protein/DNA-binding winged helix-turn-helix (wHTH) protein